MHTGGTRPDLEQQSACDARRLHRRHPQFAIEGSIFVAGAAVNGCATNSGIIGTAADRRRSHAPSQTVEAFTWYRPLSDWVRPIGMRTRAGHHGMTLGTTRAHIVRATLEAIAYQTRELIDAMQADSGERLAELRVDGGAAANNFLMQFQADILGTRIVRPADVETTALGAAYLAGLATEVWKDTEELESFWVRERVFEPQLPESRREELFAGWKQAVACVRGVP